MCAHVTKFFNSDYTFTMLYWTLLNRCYMVCPIDVLGRSTCSYCWWELRWSSSYVVSFSRLSMFLFTLSSSYVASFSGLSMFLFTLSSSYVASISGLLLRFYLTFINTITGMLVCLYDGRIIVKPTQLSSAVRTGTPT
jgi:hypothetical protein